MTSDVGLVLVRELDERLGLSKLIEHHLSDCRRGKNIQLPLADLLRQSIYSRLAGYEDVNDAARLSQDPTFRLIGSRKIWVEMNSSVTPASPQLFLKRQRLSLLAALLALFFVTNAMPRGAFAAGDPCTGTLTALSACSIVKGGITIGVPGCQNVFVDKSFSSKSGNALGVIKIEPTGALCVRDSDLNGNLQIDTAAIVDEGTFAAGSSSSPIGTQNVNNTVTINFTGNRPANAGPIPKECPAPNFNKGIEVCGKATLRLFGAEGVPSSGSARTDGTHTSWTYLSQAAGDPLRFGSAQKVVAPVTEPDASTIDVADNVDWKPNDWIVIATTSYSPYESEFVQITSVGPKCKPTDTPRNCTHIVLANPLVFYHFGSADPGTPSDANYTADSTRNYGVDERAEVGLISRNIKLTATIPPNEPKSLHWGGEIIVRAGFNEASIQGVELEKFGKDIRGSYPVHLHRDGVISSTQTLLVNANSIHHSFNKCITVHSTTNAGVTNNVCARVVGHLFYEEVGDEQNITFASNLGLGAMSNFFDVNNGTDQPRTTLIKSYWWPGDYLVQQASFNYDGFRIPDTDNQENGTAGQCFKFYPKDININGALQPDDNPGKGPTPPCRPGAIYAEPPTGFWIVNPSAILTGNSIGGCQGEGKGYWYVPPARRQLDDHDNQTNDHTAVSLIPVGSYAKLNGTLHGQFTNNRVHGCYSGLYSGDSEDITAGALTPYLNGVKTNSHPVMAEFDGLTATRNRNRGVWLRPNFYTLKDARFATNRDSVSLVTSGGPDGNYPGIYSLLSDSVVVGVSQNNVDRFGPCPPEKLGNTTARHPQTAGQVRGWTWGCIDRTSALKGENGTGGDLIGNGYPDNRWNFAGYMIYDGPALIFHDRFVNFKKDPTNLLTTTDASYLNSPPSPNPAPPLGKYEGDAALGWYQGNISSYPTANASEELSWDNVDLRHQVYTQQVNLSAFSDGDKNTTILDLDTTLSGYQVVSSTDQTVLTDVHPISLNNLELNAGGGDPGGSVDECQATGGQDVIAENRATANMSPGEVGALEFEALYPKDPRPNEDRNDQKVTFTKDSTEFDGSSYEEHPFMTLGGRDGQGVWEPKVTSGYGYTITASTGCPPGLYNSDYPCPHAGIPKLVHIGLADVVKPRISGPTATPANPFYVRVGICYTGARKSHPASADLFTITRGYRSWGGGGVDATDTLLRPFYNQLDGQSNGLTREESCFNLDHQNKTNLKTCPSVGITPSLTTDPNCPAAAQKDPTRNLCIYPKTQLTKADDINCSNGVTNCLNNNGTPNLDKYLYDPATGWLFFYVAQIRPNASGANAVPPVTGGPAPLGSCTGDTSTDPFFCPSQTGGDSYYVCPPEGCWSYSVKLTDDAYSPEPSACGNPYPESGIPNYAQAPPVLEGQMALATTPVTRTIDGGLGVQFPHYLATAASQPSSCPNPSAPIPAPTP